MCIHRSPETWHQSHQQHTHTHTHTAHSTHSTSDSTMSVLLNFYSIKLYRIRSALSGAHLIKSNLFVKCHFSHLMCAGHFNLMPIYGRFSCRFRIRQLRLVCYRQRLASARPWLIRIWIRKWIQIDIWLPKCVTPMLVSRFESPGLCAVWIPFILLAFSLREWECNLWGIWINNLCVERILTARRTMGQNKAQQKCEIIEMAAGNGLALSAHYTLKTVRLTRARERIASRCKRAHNSFRAVCHPWADPSLVPFERDGLSQVDDSLVISQQYRSIYN